MSAFWKPTQASTSLDGIPKCLPPSLDSSKISWAYGYRQNVPDPGASVASLCPADSCSDSGVVEIPNLSRPRIKSPVYLPKASGKIFRLQRPRITENNVITLQDSF